MNTLKKIEGVYYTQSVNNLPIEERVFFREGKGVNANDNYRVATAEEIAAWEDWKKRQEQLNEELL